MKKLFYLAIVLVVFTACSKQPHYEKSYSFKEGVWNLTEKPYFKVPIDDTAKFYNFTLTLRVATSYSFNNIWFYLNSKTPSGLKAREPFEMKITYPDGKWIGKKTGSIVETQIYFKSRKFSEKGNYVFVLEQAVIQDNLKDVLDVIFTVEEAS